MMENELSIRRDNPYDNIFERELHVLGLGNLHTVPINPSIARGVEGRRALIRGNPIVTLAS